MEMKKVALVVFFALLALKPCLANADLWDRAEAIEQLAQKQGIRAQFTIQGELVVQYPPDTKDSVGLTAFVDENRLALTCESQGRGWRVCRVQIPAQDPKMEMAQKAAIFAGGIVLGIVIPGGGLVGSVLLQQGYAGATTLAFGEDKRLEFPLAPPSSPAVATEGHNLSSTTGGDAS